LPPPGARRILGKLSKKDFLEAPAAPKAKAAKKIGRPRHVSLLGDAAVKAIIRERAAPSCRFRANGEVIHTLPSKSWRKFHMTTPELREKISYDTLLRRVKRCRLGVAKGKKRTDVCDVCKCWDYQVYPKVRGDRNEVWEACQRHVPGYWADFEAAVATSGFFADVPDCQRLESPHYFDILLNYLRERPGDTAHARAGMEADAVRELEKTEARAIANIENEIYPLVFEWAHRFTLRDEI